MPSLAEQSVVALYQHRMMSSTQLWQLLCPGAQTAQWPRRVLSRLRRAGLIDSVPLRSSEVTRTRVWFCTPRGAQEAESSQLVHPRPYRLNAQKAAGLHQAHALAVNDVGIAMTRWARTFGDDCGPLDWTPEVAHSMSAHRHRTDLVTDALLTYTVHRGGRRTGLQLAIELDRATMSIERLAQKVLTYCRYYTWTPDGAQYPAWRRRYPAFPRLLVVLSGRSEPALANRMADLRARVAQFPQTLAVRTSIHASITTLRELQTTGPHRPITRPLFFPGSAPVELLPAPDRGIGAA